MATEIALKRIEILNFSKEYSLSTTLETLIKNHIVSYVWLNGLGKERNIML